MGIVLLGLSVGPLGLEGLGLSSVPRETNTPRLRNVT